MSTPASIRGHPIHPMLVALPIGLWVFSFVADIVRVAGWGGPVWRVIALCNLAAGVLGALLAAVPGFIDFFSITDRRVGKIALIHMSVNLLAVGLFALSFGLRFATAGTLPLLISAAGLVSLAIAGWLGGELVYIHQMGVGKPPR